MVDVPRKRATYAEYLAIANDSPIKYEYAAGEIVATSGGTIVHGRLIGQASLVLNAALAGRACIVLPSDMRVRIRTADRSTYPDLYVVCGQPELDPDDDHAVINPKLIVDVLSDSSQDSDRTDKFAAYRRLSSLAEYDGSTTCTPIESVSSSRRERAVRSCVLFARRVRRAHPHRWTLARVLAQ